MGAASPSSDARWLTARDLLRAAAPSTPRSPWASLLVRRGVVLPVGLAKARRRQAVYGGCLDTALLELGLVDEDALLRALHDGTGLLPPPRNWMEDPDSEAATLLPPSQARKLGAQPLRRAGTELRFVVHPEADLDAAAAWAAKKGCGTAFHLVAEVHFEGLLSAVHCAPLPPRFAVLLGRLWGPAQVRARISTDNPARRKSSAPPIETGPVPERPARTQKVRPGLRAGNELDSRAEDSRAQEPELEPTSAPLATAHTLSMDAGAAGIGPPHSAGTADTVALDAAALASALVAPSADAEEAASAETTAAAGDMAIVETDERLSPEQAFAELVRTYGTEAPALANEAPETATPPAMEAGRSVDLESAVDTAAAAPDTTAAFESEAALEAESAPAEFEVATVVATAALEPGADSFEATLAPDAPAVAVDGAPAVESEAAAIATEAPELELEPVSSAPAPTPSFEAEGEIGPELLEVEGQGRVGAVGDAAADATTETETAPAAEALADADDGIILEEEPLGEESVGALAALDAPAAGPGTEASAHEAEMPTTPGYLVTSPTSDLEALLEAARAFDTSAAGPLIERLAHAGTERPSLLAALRTLTRHDFGETHARWARWWRDHGHEHRIEWLLAALDGKNPELRLEAARELEAASGKYVGYHFDLGRREREEAKRRWRRWWLESGKSGRS